MMHNTKIIVLSFVMVTLLWAAEASAAGRVFYDGFEDGTTAAWSQDGSRNKCTITTSATDGLTGVFAGTRMARCNYNGTVDWNNAASFETMIIDNYAGGGSTELLLRVRTRRDANLIPTDGSRTKILRQGSLAVIDAFDNITNWSGLMNQIEGGGSGTYWGDAPGDNSSVLGHWATIERYFNSQTGQIKFWYDNLLIRNDTVGFGTLTAWQPLNITSNWADCQGPGSPCDAVNYMYFDEIEIFTDVGIGATGSMSDGTIAQGGSDTTPPAAPTGLLVQ